MSNPYASPKSQAVQAKPKQKPDDWFLESRQDADSTATAVNRFFLEQRYRLESGNPHEAVYGIGNDILRILLGGFVKRNKFKVRVVPTATGSNIFVDKGMSGAIGGALGYARMKKELARIRKELEIHIQLA